MTRDELKEHITKVIKEDFIDEHVIDVDHLSTLCESEIINTRKVAAASSHPSLERGYNQRCQWYQNLQADVPKLHAKFHQNPWCGFGEKCAQENDIV